MQTPAAEPDRPLTPEGLRNLGLLVMLVSALEGFRDDGFVLGVLLTVLGQLGPAVAPPELTPFFVFRWIS